jgi:tRNA pseudouridine55 synthase
MGKIPDDIPSRQINIYKNEIISFDYENQILELDISCSKGTYIRTIVNDIGKILGSGAVMFKLVRTKSSSMILENSLNLTEDLNKETIEKNLINPIKILTLDSLEINDFEYQKLLNGNKFKNRKNKTGEILLVQNSKILALAVCEDDFVQPKKVLL